MASSRKSRHADPLAAIAAYLNQHRLGGTRIRVGLSGGVDSVVLLQVLSVLRGEHALQLSARHVNHGLSVNADRWQAFCETLCARWAIPFEARRVTVSLSARGLEAAAREARMHALLGEGADHLALAHHRDDQAETLIFRLVRGAGLRGAAAISAREHRGDGLTLIRPLLTVGRAEIERYALERGLEWVEDESNAGTAFARNFMRHEVLPVLARRFPAASECLARAAGHLRESLELLDALAELDWAALGAQETLDRSALLALGEPRERNLLRWRIHALGCELPDESRLREALRQLRSVPVDHPLRVPLGAVELCHYRARVWLQPALVRGRDRQPWCGQRELAWDGGQVDFEACVGAGIARSALSAGVELARRRPGDRLRVLRGGGARSIKNLAQEAGVPPWMRGRLPIVRLAGRLVWAAGLGFDAEFAAQAGEPALVPEWRPAAGVLSRLPADP